MISHGWVVDGLVVTEYGQPPIRCLPREREMTIIVLEPGDEMVVLPRHQSHIRDSKSSRRLFYPLTKVLHLFLVHKDNFYKEKRKTLPIGLIIEFIEKV